MNYNTTNLIPIKTTNDSSIICSGYYGDFYPYYAFDNNTSTSWLMPMPCWIGYKFPNPVAIGKYVITPRAEDMTQSPSKFTFEGSNDGANWAILDTHTGLTYGWTAYTPRSFECGNCNKYIYYRINISSSPNGTYSAFCHLEMYETRVRFYLIQDGNDLEMPTSSTNLTKVDSLPYTTTKFISNNFIDISMINLNIISKLNNPKYNISMLK